MKRAIEILCITIKNFDRSSVNAFLDKGEMKIKGELRRLV